jgi:putative flavoprotein involved in K+ transport
MTTPTDQVAAWLVAFGSALDRADYETAMAMFDDDACWRQLAAHPKALLRCHRVSFRQDRSALRGKSHIKAMLEATVQAARPGAWRVDGTATECDGIVDAWFTFETTVSAGVGQIRLEEGKCWMLSTVTATDGVCC